MSQETEVIIDLAAASIEEMQAAIEKIQVALNGRLDAERKEAAEKIKQIAATYGLDISISNDPAARKSSGSRGAVAAKYAHPDNPELKWTGRGRKPGWVEDWLAQGGTLEQITIAG